MSNIFRGTKKQLTKPKQGSLSSGSSGASSQIRLPKIPALRLPALRTPHGKPPVSYLKSKALDLDLEIE
jgi:hypothetical protein